MSPTPQNQATLKRSGGGAKSTAKGYGDGTRVQENPAAASEAKRPAGPKKAPKKAYDEVYQAPAPKKKKTASSTPMLAGAAALGRYYQTTESTYIYIYTLFARTREL